MTRDSNISPQKSVEHKGNNTAKAEKQKGH